jgi:hypothetical protein
MMARHIAWPLGMLEEILRGGRALDASNAMTLPTSHGRAWDPAVRFNPGW